MDRGLELAESARELIEAMNLPADHVLRQLQDELADHAEGIADSIDPELAEAHDLALIELAEGRLIALDEAIPPGKDR